MFKDKKRGIILAKQELVFNCGHWVTGQRGWCWVNRKTLQILSSQ